MSALSEMGNASTSVRMHSCVVSRVFFSVAETEREQPPSVEEREVFYFKNKSRR